MNRAYLIAGLSLVAAASSGGAIGYLVAKKQLETSYAELSTREIAEARSYFAAQLKADEFETPEKAVAALVEDPEAETEKDERYTSTIAEYEGTTVNVVGPGKSVINVGETVPKDEPDEEVEEEIIERNVFFNGEPIDEYVWDMAEELEHRKGVVCYVITEDEFSSNDLEYETTTLTYYAADDILIDEDERIIDDVSVIGAENLKRFGHGTDDKDIVFIANDAHHLIYEILRSHRSYKEDVLGLGEDEISHSDVPMRRRSRELQD